MDGTGTGRFGGVAGRVTRGSIGGASFLSGVVILVPLLVLAFALGRAGSERAPGFVAQAAVAIVLSRFALNGYAGQWRGTVLSRAGGDWFDVFAVAFRFAVLSAVWVVPLGLLGFKPGEAGTSAAAFFLGFGEGKAVALAAVYFACITLSPPVFLVVSVGAPGFGAIFSADRWRSLFSGRKGDLFLVYALYLGGTAMAALLALPLVAAAAAVGRNLAILVGGCAFVFLVGLALNLLGRLCGFFAAGEASEEEPSEVVPAPLGGLPSMPPTAGGARPRSPLFRAVEAAAGGTAATRVEEALRVSPSDPERAIRELEEWEEERGPNPVVQCALATLLFRAGREMEAVELGRRVIPQALRRGSQKQAAEAFRVFVDHADELGLKPDESLLVANTLRTAGHLDEAARTYRALMDTGGEGDGPAVKGLLRTAEAYLHRKSAPEKAMEIYDHLLETRGDSPLADYMREGRDEAERLLSRRP